MKLCLILCAILLVTLTSFREGGAYHLDAVKVQALQRIVSMHQSDSAKEDVQVRIDPDANRNLTELILSQGYPSEKYTVQTSDGFLLDLHRIPHGKNNGPIEKERNNAGRPVVFLQHGLLSSACDWVMNFDSDSLGFILADAGFDVWMGNSRGNTYSRRHVSLSPDDPRFWDWSFDEMAKYDVPAYVDFMLSHTGQTGLSYVGHSQGTTMAFALFSQRPDMRQKIKLFVALAPVATITYAPSPLVYLSLFPDKVLYDLVGHKEFLTNSELVKLFVDTFCVKGPTRYLCDNILFLLGGYDVSNMNVSRLDVYMNHSPAGVSVKDMVHFAQVHREKKFMMYDFGSPAENLKHYNQSDPPEYNVKAVDVPIVAFTATNDWLADPKDAEALLSSLPNLKAKYDIKGWNHLDFIWGEDAAKLCYTTVVQWLKKLGM